MKNFNIVEIEQPGVNQKFNESKKATLEARLKQIKTKMAAVNKKLKFIILKQLIFVSLLLLQILAAIENYRYSRMRVVQIVHNDWCISYIKGR